MATMVTTVAMVAMGKIAAGAMVTTLVTATIAITLARTATSASLVTSSSIGMIAGITSTTKAATITIAVIDLGSYPVT